MESSAQADIAKLETQLATAQATAKHSKADAERLDCALNAKAHALSQAQDEIQSLRAHLEVCALWPTEIDQTRYHHVLPVMSLKGLIPVLRMVANPGETASSADLGGSSKYSNECCED
jgi:hypothetical protein